MALKQVGGKDKTHNFDRKQINLTSAGQLRWNVKIRDKIVKQYYFALAVSNCNEILWMFVDHTIEKFDDWL